MAKENLPTISVVRNLLRYEPETGKLFWLPRGGGRFDKLFAGKEAFTATDPGGYKYGSLQSHTMRAHVVAWALAYGKWPDGHIDHENGIREDNRLKNLSLGTQAQNNRNAKRRNDNKSGVVGVIWFPKMSMWRAYINVSGSWKHIGYFDTREAAAIARKAAEAQYGFHKNHGRSSP